jgi:hypothetical protein
MEIMKQHQEKKEKVNQLNTIYKSQVAQLEADGIKVKNKRYLIQLLEKANGQVDIVKQLLDERNKQKHASATTEEGDEKMSASKRRHEINEDDIENLKRLRSAGVHGNPIKILSVFHACNESIELTIARIEKEREQREQQSGNRLQVKHTTKKKTCCVILSFFSNVSYSQKFMMLI